jgi:hypothetical protein
MRSPCCLAVGRSGKLLLVLASAVILGSESRGTHDIFLCLATLGVVQSSSVHKLLLALTSTAVLRIGPRRDHDHIFVLSRPYVFWNGASSSTSGGVWLLLVSPPLLEGPSGVLQFCVYSLYNFGSDGRENTASNNSSPCVSLSICVFPLSLLGNGSVKTFPRQWIRKQKIQELFNVSFSMFKGK